MCTLFENYCASVLKSRMPRTRSLDRIQALARVGKSSYKLHRVSEHLLVR
jgi:hypothetical protein